MFAKSPKSFRKSESVGVEPAADQAALPTVAEAERLAAERRAAVDEAERALGAAKAARVDGVELDDAALDQLDNAIAAAERSRDRARERLAIAERRLDQARAAEAAARCAAAKAALEAATVEEIERGKQVYVSALRAMLEAIRVLAEGDQRLSALARAAGEPAPTEIEHQIRASRFCRSETIEEKIEALWVATSSPHRPLSSQPEPAAILRHPEGFVIQHPSWTGERTLNPGLKFMTVEQRRFSVKQIRERLSPDHTTLAGSMALPGLKSSAPVLWTPTPDRSAESIATLAKQALAELERQIANFDETGADPRPLIIRREPVDA